VRSVSHGCNADTTTVRADLPPAIVLFVPDQNRPATLNEVGFGQRQRLINPQPARQSTTIRPVRR
jgi:hypothetical protein